jgi:Family of unknown function (DUF6527)
MPNLPLVWTDVVIADHEKYQWKDNFRFRTDLPAAIAQWNVHEGEDSQGKKRVWRSLYYMCPGGCAQIGHINVVTPDGHTDGWTWNGNLEAPTLSPSIQMLGGCRWHGYLKNGVWEQC